MVCGKDTGTTFGGCTVLFLRKEILRMTSSDVNMREKFS